MKNVITSFILHKDLYLLSISIGALLSAIAEFFIKYTPDYLFGINASLWGIALIINIVDISTGIKADTKRKEKLGEKFVFESGKGWRAFEKVFIFTMIIWFIYNLELEALRLHLVSIISSILFFIKFIMLNYVVLIELQSIGENEEVRFGKKGKMFLLLDKTIEIVNEGILKKLKTLVGI